MQRSLRALHVFDIYLNNTENWAFSLMNHLPAVDVIVASKNFISCDFYSPKFTYLRFPIQGRANPRRALAGRLYNLAAREIQRWYPAYVAVRSGRVDVIHSHFAVAGWKYLDLSARLEAPHIVSFYGFDYEYLPFIEPVWHDRYQALFAKANLFLCEGPFGAATLMRQGCPGKKIAIAPLGVEVTRIPFHRRRKRRGVLRLVQIASFREKKGHLYTARAFAEALRTVPELTLTFVGSDPVGLRKQLQASITGTVAEGKIQFMEGISFSRLHDFLSDFDAFIHPSLRTDQMDSEGGAPVVLLDAQATGMPVLSTEHADIPSVVQHGVTGLLSAERDVGALAKSIIRFAEMENDEYQEFSAAARRHVEEHYGVVDCARHIRAVYQALVDGRERPIWSGT